MAGRRVYAKQCHNQGKQLYDAVLRHGTHILQADVPELHAARHVHAVLSTVQEHLPVTSSLIVQFTQGSLPPIPNTVAASLSHLSYE